MRLNEMVHLSRDPKHMLNYELGNIYNFTLQIIAYLNLLSCMGNIVCALSRIKIDSSIVF